MLTKDFLTDVFGEYTEFVKYIDVDSKESHIQLKQYADIDKTITYTKRINKFEFMNKCKLWALKNDITIDSNVNKSGGKASIYSKYLGSANTKKISGKTEYEAVIKACLWLKEKPYAI